MLVKFLNVYWHACCNAMAVETCITSIYAEFGTYDYILCEGSAIVLCDISCAEQTINSQNRTSVQRQSRR